MALCIGAGGILKVEGHSGGRLVVIISAQSAEKIFLVPPHIFSCADPVFDGIRGTTINVKQF